MNTTMLNSLDFLNVLDFDYFREGGKRQHLPGLAMIDLKTV